MSTDTRSSGASLSLLNSISLSPQRRIAGASSCLDRRRLHVSGRKESCRSFWPLIDTTGSLGKCRKFDFRIIGGNLNAFEVTLLSGDVRYFWCVCSGPPSMREGTQTGWDSRGENIFIKTTNCIFKASAIQNFTFLKLRSTIALNNEISKYMYMSMCTCVYSNISTILIGQTFLAFSKSSSTSLRYLEPCWLFQ